MYITEEIPYEKKYVKCPMCHRNRISVKMLDNNRTIEYTCYDCGYRF